MSSREQRRINRCICEILTLAEWREILTDDSLVTEPSPALRKLGALARAAVEQADREEVECAELTAKMEATERAQLETIKRIVAEHPERAKLKVYRWTKYRVGSAQHKIMAAKSKAEVVRILQDRKGASQWVRAEEVLQTWNSTDTARALAEPREVLNSASTT